MRRPLCYVVLCYTIGIVLEYFYTLPWFLYGIGALAALLIFLRNIYLTRRCGLVLTPVRKLLCFFLAAQIAGGINCGVSMSYVDPLTKMTGETVTVMGTVISIESKFTESYGSSSTDKELSLQQPNYHKMVIKVLKIDSLETCPQRLYGNNDSISVFEKGTGSKRMLVQVSGFGLDPKILIGAEISATGVISLPEPRRNPRCFDYRMHLKTTGINTIMTCKDSDINSYAEPRYTVPGAFLNIIINLKITFIERLEKYLNEEKAGLFTGMLFGDKTGIDEDTYEAWQKNGIAHILSVSGLHMAIVYAFIIRLSGNRKGPFQSVISILFLFCYAALAGFSPSVLRAGMMILTHIVAVLLKKRYDLLTGVCAAAGIFLTINPLELFNTGFQLSFLAIISIAFAVPFFDRYVSPTEKNRSRSRRLEQFYADDTKFQSIRRRLREYEGSEIPRVIIRSLIPMIVIQLGMAPYTAYVFNYFSPAAFILNIPIIFFAGIIIPVGVIMIILTLIDCIFHMTTAALTDHLFGVGASVFEIVIGSMNGLNEAVDNTSLGHMNTVSPPVFLLLLYYGFFFILTSEGCRVLWNRKRYKSLTVVFGVIILSSVLAFITPAMNWDKSSLVFVDVGQGDCLHIRTPGGKNILIDSGGKTNYNLGKKTLLPYFLKNGVSRIDLAIITHLHGDHFKGLTELCQDMPVDKLAVYECNELRQNELVLQTGLTEEQMFFLYAGEQIRLDETVFAEILYPERASSDKYKELFEKEDENRSSLIIRLIYNGVSVLMTGDLGFEGEAELLRLNDQNNDCLSSSVLKVAHHGSRYSTGDDFLKAVSPAVAIIQVGRNTFGHPAAEVIRKLEDSGALVFRNDVCGAILMDIYDDKRIRISTTIPAG